ncbi:hypothetical protein JDV02_006636 [Purpureocillium takamizusanense]|uniref:Putative transcription factor kapC n=1 Tax=Purpureocillium takamizusanense TaxID=2060973 RepID=A0A9Q8QIY8_9HYPO|nr:uncharacterized protein JDV02_006636 [Purpureocillium takamizusanense]UNI20560.1 hypothetical protein JDV02_006636 [Purpureocillium takamizusanense]
MMLLAAWPPHSAAAPMDPTPPPTAVSNLDWDVSFRDARRRTSSATAPSPTLAPHHQHQPYHQPQHRHTQSQSQSQHREHAHLIPRGEIAMSMHQTAHQGVPTTESQYLGAGTGAISHSDHHPPHHHHHHSSSFEYFTGNNHYMSSPPLQPHFPLGQYYSVQNTESSTSDATFPFAYTSPCSSTSDPMLPASTQATATTLYQDHHPQPLSLPQSHHDEKPSLGDALSPSAVATAAAPTSTRRRRENRYRNAPPGVLSRRRAQNRASQRAYRERKEQRIRDLEQLLREANTREETLAEAYVTLQAELDQLRPGASTSPPSSSQSPCRCGSSTVATTAASKAKSSTEHSPSLPPPPPAAPPPSLPPDSEAATAPVESSSAGPQLGPRAGIKVESAAASFDHLAAQVNHAAASVNLGGGVSYAMPLDMKGFPRQI